MIGSGTIDLVLGAREPGDKRNLKMYVRELARAGLAVVLVEPNAKQPLDMRSPQVKKADDLEAQEMAKAAGNPRWLSVRAPAGVYLATTDVKRLDRYMAAAEKRYGADQVNLGIEVGRSRLLIVDCDTGAEVQRFISDYYSMTGQMISPTVLTPGKFDQATQTWVHKDGGHFYFTLPEGIELPSGGTGAYKPPGDSGWQAYWGDRQLLIPPSTRVEGAYRWNGGVMPLPEWIYNGIVSQAEDRKAKARERINSLGDSPIDKWAAVTPWADVLEPDGWTPTGRVSNCGCAEWTAPGPHDNPKSATAHDLGCSHDSYDGMNGHAPLHLWTDNPPDGLSEYVRATGSRTLSKLQYVSWTHHNGDTSAACSALAIPSSVEFDPWQGQLPELCMFTEDDYRLRDQLLAQRERANLVDIAQHQAPPPFAEADPEDTRNDIEKWFDAHAGPAAKFWDLPPVQYLIDGYLDTDSFSMIIGERGGGKSFLALDMAASIATGKPWQGHKVVPGNVAYMIGEGKHGFIERIKVWAEVHQAPELADKLLVIDEPIQVTDAQLWNGLAWWCLRHNITVLFLDTLNRISVGIEENSAKDMGRVVAALREVQTFAQCHVSLVHHTARGTDHGRGSTAVEGAADTVLLVEKPAEGRFTLACTKQKNHAQAEPVDFALKVHGPSCVVTGHDGRLITTSDPFGSIPKPEITQSERVDAVVETVRSLAPEIGLTRAAIVKHTAMNALSIRPLDAGAKERLVIMALDQAVQEGKLEGAALSSGGTSSGRYVPAT